MRKISNREAHNQFLKVQQEGAERYDVVWLVANEAAISGAACYMDYQTEKNKLILSRSVLAILIRLEEQGFLKKSK